MYKRYRVFKKPPTKLTFPTPAYMALFHRMQVSHELHAEDLAARTIRLPWSMLLQRGTDAEVNWAIENWCHATLGYLPQFVQKITDTTDIAIDQTDVVFRTQEDRIAFQNRWR